MLYVLVWVLSAIFLTVYGSEECKTDLKISQEDTDGKIEFFSEKLIVRMPNVPSGNQKFDARYLVEYDFIDDLDSELLTKCTNFILLFAGEDIKNVEDSKNFNNTKPINKNEKKKKFVEYLAKMMQDPNQKSNKKSRKKTKTHTEDFDNVNVAVDMNKFRNSLNHSHCHQAIELCGFKSFDHELITQLVIKFPEVMKKHLKIVSNLKKFSFLTPEMAIELFSERNYLLNPFSMDSLVQSVKVEVIVALLKLWDYELKSDDIKFLFEIFGENQQFLDLIDEDPRSWLLWLKLDFDYLKPFPVDQFLGILNLNTHIVRYANLLFALSYRIESIIFGSLIKLESIFNNLNMKNRSTTSDLDFNTQKWNLWIDAGKEHIDTIKEQMRIKNKIIDRLVNIELDESININNKIFTNHILNFFRVPVSYFIRIAFIQSRDMEKVIEAQLNADIHTYHLIPEEETLKPWSVAKFDLWTLMWHKLENQGGVESSYNLSVTHEMKDNLKFVAILLEINSFLMSPDFESEYKNIRIFWHIFSMILIIKPTFDIDESVLYLKTFEFFLLNQGSELQENNIFYITSILAPEAIKEHIKFIEFKNATLESFKLAPETLSRLEIKSLLTNSELREFAVIFSVKAQKLCTLVDFTADDLLEFFPLKADYHLELHPALHTATPEALIGYLRGVEGILNYPERFAWSVHPEAWKIPEFADLMAENIPYSSFVHFPKDAEKMKLQFLVCDIMGRINRCQGKDVQKLILKWAMNMEWIFNQFYAIFSLNVSTDFNISEYIKFVSFEKKGRFALIKYLKSTKSKDLEDSQELLKIIESLPLSFIRLSMCHENFIIKLAVSLKKKVGIIYLEEFVTLFKSFDVKSYGQINIPEFDANIFNNATICKNLIDKYFGPIESIAWSNRLSIVNLISSQRFVINAAVPGSYKNSIFKHNQVPVYNAQLAFEILTVLEYDPILIFNCAEEGFLQQSEESIKSSQTKLKDSEINLLSLVTLLFGSSKRIRI